MDAPRIRGSGRVGRRALRRRSVPSVNSQRARHVARPPDSTSNTPQPSATPIPCSFSPTRPSSAPANTVNPHGHLYGTPGPAGRHRNLCVERTAYEPVRLDAILADLVPTPAGRTDPATGPSSGPGDDHPRRTAAKRRMSVNRQGPVVELPTDTLTRVADAARKAIELALQAVIGDSGRPRGLEGPRRTGRRSTGRRRHPARRRRTRASREPTTPVRCLLGTCTSRSTRPSRRSNSRAGSWPRAASEPVWTVVWPKRRADAVDQLRTLQSVHDRRRVHRTPHQSRRRSAQVPGRRAGTRRRA